MKSRLIADYDRSRANIDPPDFSGVDEAVEQDLLALTRPLARMQDRTVVHPGDIVKVTLVGPTARMNRTDLTIATGFGMFDGPLEEGLTGVTVGEDCTVDSTDGPVRVRVHEAKFHSVPALSDALVKDSTDGEFATVAAFRHARHAARWEDVLSAYCQDAAFEIFALTTTQADVSLDSQEVEELVQRELERCRGLAAEQGLVFDDMTPTQFGERVGVESFDDFIAMVTDNARRDIVGALLAAKDNDRDAGTVALDEVDTLCDQYFGRLADEIRAAYNPQPQEA